MDTLHTHTYTLLTLDKAISDMVVGVLCSYSCVIVGVYTSVIRPMKPRVPQEFILIKIFF